MNSQQQFVLNWLEQVMLIGIQVTGFVTGAGGVGKSAIIAEIRKKYGAICLITSLMAKAALAIGGRTLHSALKIPIAGQVCGFLTHIDMLNTTITHLRQLLSTAEIGRNAAHRGLETVHGLLRTKTRQVQELQAERDALQQHQNLVPTCPVCHEVFRANADHTKARIYPCGHSTCSGCINHMINLRNMESEREPRINRHVVKCPQCRQETPMILPQAEKMLRNFAAEQQ